MEFAWMLNFPLNEFHSPERFLFGFQRVSVSRAHLLENDFLLQSPEFDNQEDLKGSNLNKSLWNIIKYNREGTIKGFEMILVRDYIERIMPSANNAIFRV